LYGERVDELNATTQERDDLKKLYDGLRKRRYVFVINFSSYVGLFSSLTCIVFYFRLDEFMAGFNIISLKLKEMYQVLNTYNIL
jgi:structural maintenance of chromosome 4